MANLIEIEGIGPVFAEKLKAAGLTTTDALLEAGATPKSRQELEEKTGISHAQILRWVNMADLFRIKGIGEQYSDLLEAAGVDTVPELGQRNPANLLVQLTQCNEDRQRVRKLPTADQVAGWVEQAKGLPRAVKY